MYTYPNMEQNTKVSLLVLCFHGILQKMSGLRYQIKLLDCVLTFCPRGKSYGPARNSSEMVSLNLMGKCLFRAQPSYSDHVLRSTYLPEQQIFWSFHNAVFIRFSRNPSGFVDWP